MREGRFPDARILIVDDEPGSVRLLTRLLERAGYVNLGSTTDPAAVRSIYLEQDPDLVLLDLHMPALDGIGVLEQLRAAAAPQAYLPVLMLTGDCIARGAAPGACRGRQGLRDQAVRAGGDPAPASGTCCRPGSCTGS